MLHHFLYQQGCSHRHMRCNVIFVGSAGGEVIIKHLIYLVVMRESGQQHGHHMVAAISNVEYLDPDLILQSSTWHAMWGHSCLPL